LQVVGNSHSMSSAETKLRQTHAALCAIGAQLADAALDARYAAAAAADGAGTDGGARAPPPPALSVRVVVGVCSRADADAIEARPLPCRDDVVHKG